MFLHCSYKEAVTVSSLQLSAVVQPLMLLQMVNKVSLEQRMASQWPSPVTKGAPYKETVDVPAWPTVSGTEQHQLAVVSCFAIRCSTIDNTWASKSITVMLLQCDDSGIYSVYRYFDQWIVLSDKGLSTHYAFCFDAFHLVLCVLQNLC